MSVGWCSRRLCIVDWNWVYVSILLFLSFLLKLMMSFRWGAFIVLMWNKVALTIELASFDGLSEHSQFCYLEET